MAVYLTDAVIPIKNSQTIYFYYPMENSMLITQVRRNLPNPSNEINYQHEIALDAIYAIEGPDGNFYAYKSSVNVPLDAENLRVVDANFNEQQALIETTNMGTYLQVDVWYNQESGVALLAFDRYISVPAYKSTTYKILDLTPAITAEGITFEILSENPKKLHFLKDGEEIPTLQTIGTPSLITRFFTGAFRLEIHHVFPFVLDNSYEEKLTIPLSKLSQITPNIYLIDLNYQVTAVLNATTAVCGSVGNIVVFCDDVKQEELENGFITFNAKRLLAIDVNDVLMHLNENYEVRMPGIDFPIAFVSFSIPRG